MGRQIDLRDFQGRDDRARFAAALDAAKQEPGSTVHVPAGTYVITTPLARRTRDEAISGVYGENPEGRMFSADFAFDVGLDFSGHCGTKLEAQGVTLMIDGFMEALCLKNCRDVCVEGLTVDHVREPYSRGRIESYETDGTPTRTGRFTVCFDEKFPVDERTVMPRYCAYERATGRFNMDMRVTGRTYMGGQRVRFEAKNMPEHSLRGETFYVWHAFHYRPAILIEEARNITLRGVTIHSQPGMGVVGHRSEDILLDGLSVVPAPGEYMSTNTDATHFTSCKGELRFTHCRFNGHGDDATNVHTFYHDIQPLEGNAYRGSVGVKTHSLTLDYPDAGDEMELVEKDSLLLRGTYRVLSVEIAPAGDAYIATLDAPLPPDAAEKCYLSDVTRLPRLIFSDCTTENHWARAVLIKTRHALVENCTFTSSTLVAVHIAAEEWWHEGVACEDIVVRRNRFIHCGITGHADTGGIKAEMSVNRREGTPQRHIVIEENEFDLPQVKHAVHVSNARDVLLRANRYHAMEQPVEIIACEDVVNEDA